MVNNFKSGVEATRKSIEIVEAAKVAKEIKQYGGIDVYNLMKSGQMYAVAVKGVGLMAGIDTSEADAKAAVEFLTHFTGGEVLNRNTLYAAGCKSMAALGKAHDLIEAEKEGIAINETYEIDGGEYVIDDTNELYGIDGEHICNVADIVAAKESGGLTDELFREILKSRIQSHE